MTLGERIDSQARTSTRRPPTRSRRCPHSDAVSLLSLNNERPLDTRRRLVDLVEEHGVDVAFPHVGVEVRLEVEGSRLALGVRGTLAARQLSTGHDPFASSITAAVVPRGTHKALITTPPGGALHLESQRNPTNNTASVASEPQVRSPIAAKAQVSGDSGLPRRTTNDPGGRVATVS
jgi:hypothetical protein